MERLLSSASETTGVLLFIWVGPNASSAHEDGRLKRAYPLTEASFDCR